MTPDEFQKFASSMGSEKMSTVHLHLLYQVAFLSGLNEGYRQSIMDLREQVTTLQQTNQKQTELIQSMAGQIGAKLCVDFVKDNPNVYGPFTIPEK